MILLNVHALEFVHNDRRVLIGFSSDSQLPMFVAAPRVHVLASCVCVCACFKKNKVQWQ
jgi:hypothetical protein